MVQWASAFGCFTTLDFPLGSYLGVVQVRTLKIPGGRDRRLCLQSVCSQDRIRFSYDFDQLLRLVLKLGYNVARTRGWPLAVFKEVRQYILGTEKSPPGLHLFLQLLIPTPEKDCKYAVPPGTQEIPPLPWHAELRDVSGFPGLASEFSVSFMSYRFFAVQEDPSVSSAIRKASLKEWLKDNKGTHELSDVGHSVVHSSCVSVVEVLEKDSAFENQLARAIELKARMARG